MAATKAYTNVGVSIAFLPVFSLGFFVKYDDVIRRKPGMGRKFLHTIFGSNSRDVDRREVAIRELLPKWSGFYCSDVSNSKLISMNADMALADLTDVIKQIQFPLVKEDRLRPREWKVEDLNVSKVAIIIMHRFGFYYFFVRFLQVFSNQKLRNWVN